MRKLIFLILLGLSQAVFGLTLISPAFQPYSVIPAQYTCDGANQSPPLQWTDMPDKAEALVLYLSDPDAPTGNWNHWIVFNLPATINGIAGGVKQLPQGGTVLANSWGKSEYDGPCPPPGSEHHYIFQLYALDQPLSLPDNATKDDVDSAMQDHTLASAELIGLYERNVNPAPKAKNTK